MGSKNPGVITPRNCDVSVRQAIQQLATRIIGLESTPTFAGLSLGTGELTIGSINKASGTLTLEVGGVAQVSITDANVLFAGTFESTGIATLADASLLKTSAAPTTDAMIANKKYVDDEVATGIGAGGHTHDTDTLQLDSVNSDGGAFSFTTTGTVTFNQPITATKTCTAAAGLNVLRITGLQTDGTAMTGTLRGAYIDVSNGSTVATGTIRGMELKART